MTPVNLNKTDRFSNNSRPEPAYPAKGRIIIAVDKSNQLANFKLNTVPTLYKFADNDKTTVMASIKQVPKEKDANCTPV